MLYSRRLPWLVLTLLFAAPLVARADVLVRMQISAGAVDLGAIDLQLSDTAAPLTVANFLRYLGRRDYDETFWHRSVRSAQGAPLLIHGGGYWPLLTGSLPTGSLLAIPRDPPVPSELGLSNLRGAIAMSRPAGAPNGATSEWFINVADNPVLDTEDGGFTVFGHVTAASLGVVDAIAAFERWNFSAVHGGAFDLLPLSGYPGSGTLQFEQLVRIRRTLLVADGQCGDVNDDLVVDDLDPVHYRSHLADPTGTPLGAAGLAKCSVIEAPSSCTILDVVVMLRDLAFQTPRIAPVCDAAL